MFSSVASSSMRNQRPRFNLSTPTSHVVDDSADLEYLDYHTYRRCLQEQTNEDHEYYVVSTPPTVYEHFEKREAPVVRSYDEAQYDLTANLFDPMKETPPNCFMDKLQQRMALYYMRSPTLTAVSAAPRFEVSPL